MQSGKNNRKHQEGLAPLMLGKPVALAEFTSFLLSILYLIPYLTTFENMRIVFNITLSINLMIDAAGRGEEMPFNRGEPRKGSLISRATANHTHQLYAPK
jgi:hypothetical protein